MSSDWSDDVSDLARQVAVPTLVLHAQADAAVPFEEGCRLAALIPGAQFVPLDSENHVLLESELAWWRERLAGAPAALELPTDRPRPAVQSYRGARLPLWIPPPVTEALRRLARDGEATLYMVLLAAFDVLLRSWTGQDDLVVGAVEVGC